MAKGKKKKEKNRGERRKGGDVRVHVADHLSMCPCSDFH